MDTSDIKAEQCDMIDQLERTKVAMFSSHMWLCVSRVVICRIEPEVAVILASRFCIRSYLRDRACTPVAWYLLKPGAEALYCKHTGILNDQLWRSLQRKP